MLDCTAFYTTFHFKIKVEGIQSPTVELKSCVVLEMTTTELSPLAEHHFF